MKINGWVMGCITAVGIITALSPTGCSNESDTDTEVAPDLPLVLSKMQGSWVSNTTNGCTDRCGVLIDQFTVRILYQETPDGAMERQSAIIDRIDEEKHFLITHEGRGVWPYYYGVQDGEEHLEIEFFSERRGAWQRMHLRRAGG